MATDGSKGPAEGKREKISKAQQYTMLEVLGVILSVGYLYCDVDFLN